MDVKQKPAAPGEQRAFRPLVICYIFFYLLHSSAVHGTFCYVPPPCHLKMLYHFVLL